MKPVLLTPPASPLISLADAKAFLKVTWTDEDALITSLIGAAMQYLDGWGGVLGRCILPQTWRVPLAGFVNQCLPFPDVRAVAIKYLDPALAVQTLSTSAYRFGSEGEGGYLYFERSVTFPVTATREDAIWAEAEFGYAIGANLDGLKVAALHLVAHFRSDREGRSDLPKSVADLIAPFRFVTF